MYKFNAPKGVLGNLEAVIIPDTIYYSDLRPLTKFVLIL